MLSNQQRQAISALLLNPKRSDAAARIGVTDRTINGYFANEEFVREYEKAWDRVTEQITRTLQISLSDAITTLSDVARNEDAPAGARVSASRTLLEQAARWLEVNDFAQRIQRLEEITKEG